MNDERHSRDRFTFAVVLLLAAAVLVGITTWGRQASAPVVDVSKYQVVFLMGNQQYFGRLKNINTPHPYLTDIYYVSQKDEKNGGGFKLVKLGNELHGPEDVMYLNWQNVLFWQNLKPDSQVVRGIIQEKQQRLQGKTQEEAQIKPADSKKK